MMAKSELLVQAIGSLRPDASADAMFYLFCWGTIKSWARLPGMIEFLDDYRLRPT